jgi:hypothetical protein
MTIEFIWKWGSFALATAACAAAVLWGGWAARRIGATFWIAWVASLLLASNGPKGPGDQILLIDTIVLFIFVAIALKARHIWVLLTVASQLDDVASHVAQRLLHFGVYSYMTATSIWGGQFITFCLIAGTIGYRLRLKRHALAKAARSPAAS